MMIKKTATPRRKMDAVYRLIGRHGYRRLVGHTNATFRRYRALGICKSATFENEAIWQSQF